LFRAFETLFIFEENSLFLFLFERTEHGNSYIFILRQLILTYDLDVDLPA